MSCDRRRSRTRSCPPNAVAADRRARPTWSMANGAAIATSGPSFPDRLLGFLGITPDQVGMVDHQARAPAMGAVEPADLDRDVEPGFEVEPIAAEPRRTKNRARPAASMSCTDASGICRACSAAAARSAKRGAMARTWSSIACLVMVCAGAGKCGIAILVRLARPRPRRRSPSARYSNAAMHYTTLGVASFGRLRLSISVQTLIPQDCSPAKSLFSIGEGLGVAKLGKAR